MPRLLADENVGRNVISALREAGFDVFDLKEKGFSGMQDEDVLALAVRGGRVLVTHDKDFADPALCLRRNHPGIVLLRLADSRPESVVPPLLRVLKRFSSRRLRNSVVEVGEGYSRKLGK